MALFDNPPHRTTSHTVASSRDAGGGTTLTYTVAQTSIPCSINTASSSEKEMFAQQQISVTHTVAYLSATLTTPLTRGMKLTDEAGLTYVVHGISKGRAYGSIPAFTMAYCEQLL